MQFRGFRDSSANITLRVTDRETSSGAESVVLLSTCSLRLDTSDILSFSKSLSMVAVAVELRPAGDILEPCTEAVRVSD